MGGDESGCVRNQPPMRAERLSAGQQSAEGRLPGHPPMACQACQQAQHGLAPRQQRRRTHRSQGQRASANGLKSRQQESAGWAAACRRGAGAQSGSRSAALGDACREAANHQPGSCTCGSSPARRTCMLAIAAAVCSGVGSSSEPREYCSETAARARRAGQGGARE